MTTKPRRSTDGQKVEFRWRQHEDEQRQRLVELAEEARRSPSDHAREMLKAALTTPEELLHSVHLLRQEISQLKLELVGDGQSPKSNPTMAGDAAGMPKDMGTRLLERLDELGDGQLEIREDIATCVVKMLVDVGNIDPKHARNWAGDMLNGQSDQ
jgi:hypothetical protein